MAVDLKHIHIITNLHIMCNTPRLEEYVYIIHIKIKTYTIYPKRSYQV